MTLRDDRRRAGLTQEELAVRAGVSVRTLRDLEAGRVEPYAATVAKLRSALHGEVAEGDHVSVAILGPLVLRVGGVPRPIRSAAQRLILGLLALRSGEDVMAGDIAELLWPLDRPDAWRNLIQVHVSRLRDAIEPQRVRRAGGLIPSGRGDYRLEAGPEQLDAARFEQLVRQGRGAADPGAALTAWEEALACWRGPVLSGDDERLGQHPAAAALHRQRIATAADYADAALTADRPADARRILEDVVAVDPLNESLHAKLMTALAATGEPAAALRAYAGIRDRLRDELGLDPGERLTAAHRAILRRGEPDPADAPAPMMLPPRVADFTGRAAELARLRPFLAGTRPRSSAVVLSGMGGIGKTALALQAAYEARGAYPDGCLYAELGGLDPVPVAPHAVLSTLLRALGVTPAAVPTEYQARLGLFRTLTADRRILVVLDNAADEAQVRPLLPPGSGCRTIITARTPLRGLDGATHLRLPPLDPVDSRRLVRSVAATAADAELDEIVEVCAGVPLALRIASARLAAGGRPGRLRASASVLDALAVGDRSVRATLQPSVDALPAEAERLLRLLAHSPLHDADALAAAHLAAVTPEAAAGRLRLLRERAVLSARGPRFSMHDLIRAYAVERPGFGHEPVDRLLSYYVDAAYAAARLITGGRSDLSAPPLPPIAYPAGFETVADAVAWFEAERLNLTTTIRAAAEAGSGRAWHLACGLRDLFRHGNQTDDWLDVTVVCLDLARRQGDRLGEARMLENLGSVYVVMLQYAEATEVTHAALRLYEELGDRYAYARAHGSLGITYWSLGDFDRAEFHNLASIAEPAYAAHPIAFAYTLLNLGAVYGQRDDHDRALANYLRALDIARTSTDSILTCTLEHNAGWALVQLGRYADAISHAEAEIAVARNDRRLLREARGLELLGDCYQPTDETRARRLWEEALEIYDQLGHQAYADDLRQRL